MSQKADPSITHHVAGEYRADPVVSNFDDLCSVLLKSDSNMKSAPLNMVSPSGNENTQHHSEERTDPPIVPNVGFDLSVGDITGRIGYAAECQVRSTIKKAKQHNGNAKNQVNENDGMAKAPSNDSPMIKTVTPERVNDKRALDSRLRGLNDRCRRGMIESARRRMKKFQEMYQNESRKYNVLIRKISEKENCLISARRNVDFLRDELRLMYKLDVTRHEKELRRIKGNIDSTVKILIGLNALNDDTSADQVNSNGIVSDDFNGTDGYSYASSFNPYSTACDSPTAYKTDDNTLKNPTPAISSEYDDLSDSDFPSSFNPYSMACDSPTAYKTEDNTLKNQTPAISSEYDDLSDSDFPIESLDDIDTELALKKTRTVSENVFPHDTKVTMSTLDCVDTNIVAKNLKSSTNSNDIHTIDNSDTKFTKRILDCVDAKIAARELDSKTISTKIVAKDLESRTISDDIDAIDHSAEDMRVPNSDNGTMDVNSASKELKTCNGSSAYGDTETFARDSSLCDDVTKENVSASSHERHTPGISLHKTKMNLSDMTLEFSPEEILLINKLIYNSNCMVSTACRHNAQGLSGIASCHPGKGPLIYGGRVFRVGRHQGRTFEQVFKLDPTYHKRCFHGNNYQAGGAMPAYRRFFTARDVLESKEEESYTASICVKAEESLSNQREACVCVKTEDSTMNDALLSEEIYEAAV